MNVYIIELIFVNLLLFLLFSIYQIIKNKLSFFNRRIVLLILPLIVIIGGVLNYQLSTSTNRVASGIKLIELDLITISNSPTLTTNPYSFFSTDFWLLILVLGMVASLIYSFYKILRNFLFFKGKSFQKLKEYNLLISNEQQCFSFFKFIHLSAQLNDDEQEIVLEHELIHVKKKHSFDLILMEFYQALFWYNPLFLFIKKELIIVQEYEVDEQMFNKYGNAYISNLLNHALGTSSSQLVLTSQFFNHISLAKRTKIMKQKTKTTKWLLVVVPLTAILMTLVSFTSRNQSNPSVNLQDVALLTQKDSIYETADINPEFPGGEEAMQKFIGENFHLSDKIKKEGKEGKVFTSFVVNRKGEIKEVKTLKGVTPDIDAECRRVIEIMPKWKPGKKAGKKVSVRYIIPINVKLKKD